MANGMPIIRTRAPLPQGDGNKKVIDVVDLDDDDDVTPTMPSQMVIPTGQLRLIPANQLQQQGLAYAVVSSANSPAAGLNRVLIARPQTSGQILVSRNMNGMITRAPQVIKLFQIYSKIYLILIAFLFKITSNQKLTLSYLFFLSFEKSSHNGSATYITQNAQPCISL